MLSWWLRLAGSKQAADRGASFSLANDNTLPAPSKTRFKSSVEAPKTFLRVPLNRCPCSALSVTVIDGVNLSPASKMAFSLFAHLPFELREQIWTFAMPDDVPEVRILEDADLLPPTGQLESPECLLVRRAYPALMHTCHESRAFVLSWRSGVAIWPDKHQRQQQEQEREQPKET